MPNKPRKRRLKKRKTQAGANGGTGGNKSGPSANRANTNVTGGDAAKKEVPTAFSGGGPADAEPFVVAVTACPTGIAHTFMAEDALKKKPARWG